MSSITRHIDTGGRKRWILAAMLVALVGSMLIVGNAFAVHEQGFELDGNIEHDNIDPAPLDWDDLFTAVGVAEPTVNDPLPANVQDAAFVRDFEPGESGPDRTTFATGSKDTLNILTGWECARDNNVNDKTDIVNAYAALYDDGSGPMLYFALERYSKEGDGNVGFWFLQDPAVDCIAPEFGPSTTSFTGNHTEGDLLVVSEFTKGGVVSTVNVYEWVGGAGGALNPIPVIGGGPCDLAAPGDTVCATVNTVLLSGSAIGPTAEVPWLTETKKPGNTPSNDLDVSEFYEAGLDLGQLGFGEVCFGTFLAVTRASQTLNATIFDYALGHIDVCDAAIQVAADGVNQVGDDHTFTVHTEKTVSGTTTDVAGVVPVITWVGATPESVDATDCAAGTDVNGECDVIINSSTTGSFTIHVAADIPVGGQSLHKETDGTGDNSGNATKTYVDAQITVATSGTNQVGDNHTFTVTVEKDLGDGGGFVAASGVTVTASELGIGALTGTGTCETASTDGSGQCTIIVSSSDAGVSTVGATATVGVSGVNINVATDGYGAHDISNEKTWVDAQITVATSGTNQVGDNHSFTVTVEKDLGDGGGFVAASGVAVTASELGIGALTGTGTCETATTDGSGQCTIIVSSSDAGVSTVGATATVNVSGVNIDVSTAGYGAHDISNTKTWVDAQITVASSGTNKVGDNHSFTVTVEKDLGDGGGFVAASGVTVTASELGIGALTGTGTCETANTDGSGQCTIIVSSSDTGVSTVGATATVGVSGVNIDVSTAGYGAHDISNEKTWVDAQITIITSGTNQVGDDHSFTVTVEKDLGDGGGFVAASGVAVTASELGIGALTGTGTCETATTDGSGQCTIIVSSSDTGQSTVNASATVDVSGVNVAVATNGYGAHDISNTKTWVDAQITVATSGTNQVGDDHSFTVTVEKDLGDGGGWVAASGVTVTASELGIGALTGTGTCETANTDGSGQCTIIVSSSDTGVSTVGATATVGVSGVNIDVSTAGYGAHDISNTKTWVDAQITVATSGTNQVGDDHSFTVTVEKDLGDGGGFVAASGVTVAASELGIGALTGTGTCETATTDGSGQCTIIVSSSDAGVSTVGATATVGVSGVNIDVSTAGYGAHDISNEKTWVDAQITVATSGTNQVGNNHTFTVTIEKDLGDGGGWIAASGVTVAASELGIGALTGTGTCETATTDGSGQCTIIVSSNVAGQSTVNATATVDVSGVSIDVDTEGYGVHDISNVKTWGDAQITIVTSGTNQVGDDHSFTVTVEKDIGGGFVAASGLTVTASELGIGALTGTGTCETATTDGSGQCTIIVSSSDTGQSTVNASTTVNIGGGVNINVATDGYGAHDISNEKTWVDAQITVATSGTNKVGDNHTFTVTVEKDLGDGGGFVAASGVTVAASELGIGALTGTGTCETATTDGSGQCTIIVSSSDTGQSTVNASATVSVGGVNVAVATNGYGAHDVSNVKTWVDAQISIATSGTNEVGDDHTFTVTVQQDLGGGGGWVAASGVTVTASELGVGALTGTGTCETATTDGSGQCTIIVSSSDTGVSTVNATATVTVGGVPINVATNGYGANVVSNVKTWVDALITVDPDGLNPVGTTHLFTIHVEKDIGDGNGFVAAQGENPTWTLDNTLGATGVVFSEDCSTTGTDASGNCSVTITSPTAGFTEIHALVDVQIGSVSVHRETDSSAVSGGRFNSDDALKEWFAPNEGLTPGFWQNLNNGGSLWDEDPDPDFNPANGNPYYTSQLWEEQTVFAGNSGDGGCAGLVLCELTMLDIVGTGGGSDPVVKAARDAIAAGLNAAHGNVAYPTSLATIQADWAAAIQLYIDSGGTDTSLLEAFHTKYAAWNELGADLGS